eukprot:CAMPEP_0204170102 /NCGR_PEP_ID=MMETSP0361-20130328/42100_1 /ASSEMBLY_ACC=CAM_ASM_000343 /TAXON_ID=268821 /ORGANISM="Scrippsiella Hangoei, Strain SHTV-5" /LENGTH=187 /DNA_ID=CAMNT_0051127781 /DNA_START=186 /DNA_END=750 /DNA_ORIENTATION=-
MGACSMEDFAFMGRPFDGTTASNVVGTGWETLNDEFKSAKVDAFAQTQEADFGQEEGYLPQCRANCRAEDFRGHTQALHEDDRGQVSLRGVCLVVIVSCGVRAVSLSVCLRVDARRSKHRSHLMGGYIMNVGAASVVLVDCLDVAGLCKLVLLARAVEVVIESHCSPLLNCVLMIEPCHFLWPMEVI